MEQNSVILLFTTDTVLIAAPVVVIVLALASEVPHPRGVAGTARCHSRSFPSRFGSSSFLWLCSASELLIPLSAATAPRGQSCCSPSSHSREPRQSRCRRTGGPEGPAGLGEPRDGPREPPQPPSKLQRKIELGYFLPVLNTGTARHVVFP